MKRTILILSFFINCEKIFSQAVAFAPLPNAPMGKALCFAYNSVSNRIWLCTATKVFYSDNNGAVWVNTSATGVTSPSAIALTGAGTPYIITPQNGMRHYNGTAWIADNNGLPVNPMPQFTSLAIDAAGNVYAGSGWHGLPPNYSGVWKWNGTVWVTMNTGLPTAPVSPAPEVTSMAMDASGNLFAGTAKVLLNGGGQGFGVYKWNGSSWNSFGTGLSNLNVASLAINASGELFVGTFNSIAHIPTATGGAWTNSTTGLPAVATTVRSITFDGSNNIYAGLGYLPKQAGSLFGAVYISNNNGASWTASNNFANLSTAVNAMVTDNAGDVFAGATGVYRSTDQGASWAIDTVGLIKVRSRGGYTAINSVGHIFSAGEGGIFKSMDNGITWQLIINGIDRHDLTCVVVDKNDHIYLGGQIWVGGSIRSDSGRVWKSVNGGSTWTKANVQDHQISEFKLAANGDVYVALVFGTIANLAYTHDGTNWNLINPYAVGNNGSGGFSVDLNSRGHIFVGTEIAQLRRSTDAGATFVSSTNLPPGNVQLVRVSPHDVLFVNGPASFGTPPLYYSDSINNGTSFTQSSNFPVGKSITDIAFDNRDSMYVGTQGGLYTTSLPFNPATSIFSLNASNGAAAVTNFTKDMCGYLYTSNFFGGISKSTVPVAISTCNVVPVTFLDFTAAFDKNTAAVQLDWRTTNEINNHHFIIEKSIDGRRFDSLGKVNPISVGLIKSYSFKDNFPCSGACFYRIGQVDNDGQTGYSKILSIRTGGYGIDDFSFYPNPLHNTILIKLPGLHKFKYVEIENSAGQKLSQSPIPPAQNSITLNLAGLQAGLYFIKITDAETGVIVVKKIIKE